MSKYKTLAAFVLLGLIVAGCRSTDRRDSSWKEQLSANLAVLGAQNWIVIAEASYPAYTGNGVRTIVADGTADEIFSEVLNTMEAEGHVQPRIMVCSELRSVDEDYAPGVRKFRNNLYKLLPGRQHFELPSRIINGQVENAAQKFNLLVIKTKTHLPYSNIFITLDSGYWNSESETNLRSKLEGDLQPIHIHTEEPPAIDSLPTLPKSNTTPTPAAPSPSPSDKPVALPTPDLPSHLPGSDACLMA
jgi:D-ribose pyranose/furanose isomerase RbsD